MKLAQLERLQMAAANSCEAGFTVGAMRIEYDRLCTAARFHIAEENPGCLLCATMGSMAYGITIDVPPFATPFVLFGLAPANASHLRAS